MFRIGRLSFILGTTAKTQKPINMCVADCSAAFLIWDGLENRSAIDVRTL